MMAREFNVDGINDINVGEPLKAINVGGGDVLLSDRASCSNKVTPNLVFFSLPDLAIAHCINQNELVPSKLLPKHKNTSS